LKKAREAGKKAKLIVRDNRAFFKNSSVGGGGIYKKGPYYTECGEMIDGLLVIKSLVW
jgi:hypothetical protein